MTDKISKIRNFSIIAHIDHGKSTLADWFLKKSSKKRNLKSQALDSMDIERERGITIKAQTVRVEYESKSGETYIFNLIDTPGHVDFSYEVSRSLAACEGSLLVVDASQGVEAQTLANVYKAMENNHVIIPILNKIDLPAADIEKTKQNIEEVIGIDATDAIPISAKTGLGIENVFEAIIGLPAPVGDVNGLLRALLVDSWYDKYLGVIVLVRVKDGYLEKGMHIKMMSSNTKYFIDKVGIFLPEQKEVSRLEAGELGFVIASIRHIEDCAVGDTITSVINPSETTLGGFKPSISVVFCSLYPEENDDFEKLKIALSKLRLNDSSFNYEVESSMALGMGFRCGFLGLLHMEIILERIEKEFDIAIINTAPGVSYEIITRKGETIIVRNPSDMPEAPNIQSIAEPWVCATIIVPGEHVGAVIDLCILRRGIQKDMSYSGNRIIIVYNLPLGEIMTDFYDKLKSTTSGYASFDCEPIENKIADIVQISMYVNGIKNDALSCLVERKSAMFIARQMCQKLKENITRQQFEIIIQSKIGGKIIARETIKAYSKQVTVGATGKDRKQKKLKAQREGKKRMNNTGVVKLPKSAYRSMLKKT